jgi:hypothetical protein
MVALAISIKIRFACKFYSYKHTHTHFIYLFTLFYFKTNCYISIFYIEVNTIKQAKAIFFCSLLLGSYLTGRMSNIQRFKGPCVVWRICIYPVQSCVCDCQTPTVFKLGKKNFSSSFVHGLSPEIRFCVEFCLMWH